MEETEDRSDYSYSETPRRPSLPKENLDTEFKEKYPPEPLGEELADYARVWKVYRDEATKADAAMLDGWNKTLDILLVFAGLFSAVVTSFVGQSNTQLQPDTNAYLANALFHLVTSNGNVSALPTPPSLDAAPTSTVVWVNALWFTSLLLSLTVAFLCILAKQWIGEYVVRTTASSNNAHDWSRRRAFYFRGLDAWGLPGFLSFLPVLLHISLFLFIAGLCLFMWAASRIIALCLISVGGSLAVFYIVATFVPLWRPDCPTAVPLIGQLRAVVSRTSLGISRTFLAICIACFPAARKAFCVLRRLVLRPVYVAYVYIRQETGRERVSTPLHSASDTFIVPFFDDDNYIQPLLPEHGVIPHGLFVLHAALRSLRRKTSGRALGDAQWSQVESLSDADALRWLILDCSDHDVVAVGYQALGAIVPNSELADRIDVDHAIHDTISLERAFTYKSPAADPSPTEVIRMLRSVLFIRPSLFPHHKWYWLTPLRSVCYPDMVLASNLFVSASLMEAAKEAASDLTHFPTVESTIALLLRIPSLSTMSFCALLYGFSYEALVSNRALIAAKLCVRNPQSFTCIHRRVSECPAPFPCLAETICAGLFVIPSTKERYRCFNDVEVRAIARLISHLLSFDDGDLPNLFDMSYLSYCLVRNFFITSLDNEPSVFAQIAKLVRRPEISLATDMNRYRTAIAGLANMCRHWASKAPEDPKLSDLVHKVMLYTVFLTGDRHPHSGLEVVSSATEMFRSDEAAVFPHSAFRPPWEDLLRILSWAPFHRLELALFMIAPLCSQYLNAGELELGLKQLNASFVHLLRDGQGTDHDGVLLRAVARHLLQLCPTVWASNVEKLEAGGIAYFAGEVTRDVLFLGPCPECPGHTVTGHLRWERGTEIYLIGLCQRIGVRLDGPEHDADPDLQFLIELIALGAMVDAV